MAIKLKIKDANGKEAKVEVRDEIQAAAFEKAGFEPATKEDADKLAKLKGQKVEE